MPKLQDLPFLMQLLDDEDPDVRQQVRQQLGAWGGNLETVTAPYWDQLSDPQMEVLRGVSEQIRHSNFHTFWEEWLEDLAHPRGLYLACEALADRMTDFGKPPFRLLMEDMVVLFKTAYPQPTFEDLMKFLFVQQGFHAPKGPFHQLDNSLLGQVILRKEGTQISLCAIAMILAQEVGLELHGVNIPGHFMMAHASEDGWVIRDPFRSGHPLPESLETYLIRRLEQSGLDWPDIFSPAANMVSRMLRNLAHAADKSQDKEHKALFDQWLLDLQGAMEIEPDELS
ncbi:transglutaminase family protein [Pontibacter sp. G13]|uniref:transglutaminase family protein n=1 Tax=Pontibacter sp. G13 TaxID=3074898 RepID=UPI002889CF1E|nr:transglutaminase family protein [Pontibacter sp. G13]WNJ19554.1 transglutaminase family protein [Pontibacter sp. G13]